MIEIANRGSLTYSELLPLEVASFGDGAVTKVQYEERVRGPYWTARVNGVLAGFLCATAQADELHISRLEVAPDHRRRGIAWRLIEKAREFATGENISRITLRVRTDNDPARSLYHKFGFRETGRRLDRFACPVERLAIETDLRAERLGAAYKYPVRFMQDVREIGKGNFNEEVSGIKDLSLTDADILLLPALAALKPRLKPDSQILAVMTDDDKVIQACQARKFPLESTLIDLVYEMKVGS